MPKEISNDAPDVAVFQTGSIEITNFDVKRALMDTQKDISAYEEEWYTKVEQDSANLYNLALNVTQDHPKTKVVIVKRLPRYDSKSSDPIGIKSKLSAQNNRYEKLHSHYGSPAKVVIEDLNLGWKGKPFEIKSWVAPATSFMMEFIFVDIRQQQNFQKSLHKC